MSLLFFFVLFQCQNSIKRLAESIQTVKTVLGMKIQSEQKLVSNLLKSDIYFLTSNSHLVNQILHNFQFYFFYHLILHFILLFF